MDKKLTLGFLVIIIGFASLVMFNRGFYTNQRVEIVDPFRVNESRIPQISSDLPKSTEKFTKVETEILLPSDFTSETREVKDGDAIRVAYRGWLASEATTFDQNLSREGLVVDKLGAGLIAGWNEGLIGMKLGEVRRLKIPSEKAYGENGSGEFIPPNSDLYFDVELLQFL